MKKIVSLLLLTGVLFFNATLPTYAAQFYSGESIFLAENTPDLNNIYSFGSTVLIEAPVKNDVVAGGGTVTINGPVAGGILAGGGTIVIRSQVGNTIRAAGGEIIISGPVAGDIVLAAGNLHITDTATVSGDVVFTGEKIVLDAPVGRNVKLYAQEAVINTAVKGNVEGEIANLTLTKNASIGGTLTYKSEQKATLAQGATVSGKETFSPLHEETSWTQTHFSTAVIYKLLGEIIAGILLIIALPLFVKRIIDQTIAAPLASIGKGVLFSILCPVISLFLLVLLLPGIAGFLFYGLILIGAALVSKIVAGWYVLKQLSPNKNYTLDFKAGIVGPMMLFALSLIPVVGDLTVLLLFIACCGTIAELFFYKAKKMR